MIWLILVAVVIILSASAAYYLHHYRRCTKCNRFTWLRGDNNEPLCELCRNRGDFAKLEIEMEQEDKRYCAVCRKVMEKHFSGDEIAVDACPEHGVWLDPGELEALVNSAYDRGYSDGLEAYLAPASWIERIAFGKPRR